MNIPKPIAVGEESTMAGNRLILADPRGEISEEDLLEFLENYMEPIFWKWREQKQATRGVQHGRKRERGNR